jgi:hypothetical protein
MSKNENALAIPEPSAFAILQPKGLEKITTLVKENMAGEDFSASDLPQIKVPAGGGTIFEVSTPAGPVAQAAIDAIVLFAAPGRGYWEKGMDEEGGGEGSPPDCSSDDMIIGIGEPGGLCKTCPKNQFGTATKGAGKACKERRNVYILTPGMLLPYNLRVPATSLKGYKSYLQGLTSADRSINGVITRITLEKTKSKGNITYAQLKFQYVGELNGEQWDAVRKYRQLLEVSLSKQPVSPGATPGSDAPQFHD